MFIFSLSLKGKAANKLMFLLRLNLWEIQHPSDNSVLRTKEKKMVIHFILYAFEERQTLKSKIKPHLI